MLKWKPGAQNEVAMRVKYRLPITFMLKKETINEKSQQRQFSLLPIMIEE